MWTRKAETPNPDPESESAIEAPNPLTEEILSGEFPGWRVREVTLKYITEEMPQAWQVRNMQAYLSKVYARTARISSIDLLNAKSWTEPQAKFEITITLR